MSRIFWDTNLFIYLLEEYGEFTALTRTLAERMRARQDQLFTSTLTLGEVSVKPLERGDLALASRFEDVLKRRTVLIPFEVQTARNYAFVRRDRSIRVADAIQLACAAQERMDMFVTNDDSLSEKVIPGIHFIVSLRSAVEVL